MAEKENRKKNWLVDSFQTVACKDKKLSPFLNVFIFEGLTPEQKKIGRLFGAIQVFDYDEKSAYLPNLVAQVIKKEFFKESRRSGEVSFEAALRKANLALSDLASHEIVGWIGKFQAVVGAIWENNFWFTQSGGGKIILIRKKIANEISAGLDSEESASHPIKTFSNISSGRLEDGDKIIFATENVFDEKRWEEFNRHITVFSSSELDNLLRSTIELEADNAGFAMINIQEGTAPAIIEKDLSENLPPVNLNFFGQGKKAQEKESPEKQAPLPTPPPEQIQSLSDSSPFEKEPELYIKETEPTESQASEEKTFSSPAEKTEEDLSPMQAIQIENPVPLKEKLFFWKHPRIQTGLAGLQTFSQKSRGKLNDLKPNWDFSSSKAKLEKFFQPQGSENQPSIKEKSMSDCSNKFSFKNQIGFLEKFFSFKKVSLLFLGLLLVFFFAKTLWDKNQEKRLTEKINPEEETHSPVPTEEETGKILKQLAVLPEKINFSAFLKKKIYFVSENNSFFQLENLDQKEAGFKKIELPSEMGKVENLASMNDLNLIFLSDQKQIYAFSPVTGKILPHAIADLPQTKTASFSYLTYLYFLDAPNHQISQYPRAGAGFGDKKVWLKESADLSQIIDFTADEAIYLLSSDGQISRYFRGKKTGDFFVEKDGRKIIGRKIRTSTESDWLFLLSPQEKTLFQLNKTGQIINQWSSSQLIDAEIMEIDFESKIVYVLNSQQAVLEIRFE